MTERQQRIFDYLNGNPAGVLATVDPNGEPHATVIYHHIYEDDFSISFLTKRGTKKYDNLIRKNHVVLVVFDMFTQTVAQVFGEAQEVTDPEKINLIFRQTNQASLKTSDGGIPPIAKLNAGEFAAFMIEPVQIRMACYARPDSGDYSHVFESLESFELKPAA